MNKMNSHFVTDIMVPWTGKQNVSHLDDAAKWAVAAPLEAADEDGAAHPRQEHLKYQHCGKN